MKNRAVIGELGRIAERHGGFLRPKDVVEAARSERSPLHKYFDWNDAVGADKWRLHQARQLIKVTVTYAVGNGGKIARVFVSLSPDRTSAAGYRTMVSVMSTKQLRDQLLQDALDDMRSFERKYQTLRELAAVFAAMRSTGKRLRIQAGVPA